MVSEQEIVERLFEVYKLNRRYAEQKYGRFMPGRGSSIAYWYWTKKAR